MVPPATPTPPSSSAASPASPSEPAKTLKAQIEELENQGKLPKLDRSASIVGPDVNANGVRDDIEAFISSLSLTPDQRTAAMQDARSLQNTLTVDLTDKAALQKVGDELMASSNCMGDTVPNFHYLSGKIEAMTANTRERSKRYMEYNAARSGSVTSLPNGDTCEK
jgi:hypothetical protein